MRVDIKVPSVGESITEVQIGEWLKQAGETVSKDENLLLLETDKATVEIHAPQAGTLTEVLKKNGESAGIGEVIGRLESNGGGPRAGKPESAPAETHPAPGATRHEGAVSEAAREEAAPAQRAADPGADAAEDEPLPDEEHSERAIEMIAAKERAAQEVQDAEPAEDRPPRVVDSGAAARESKKVSGEPPPSVSENNDEVVPMSLLRRRIAERLVAAQQSAALLTTFNEIDMTAVIDLRHAHGEAFQRKHGVKLGFMSFFVRSSVAALRAVREINAEIAGDKIVYHKYYDVGVAVGGGKGLVVPVLRRAERMSFAEIERAIADFAARAQENRLRPDELQGGTFTITNGGVYGSLLSTPIVNPPQSAILGLHAIQDRPVARDGNVVVRPMMYAALTYDHRLIDGREAVLFLKHVKELIEAPARLLLEF
jgi:2-oxoglutarate dehydrogenase E2 component (dihydrolipoamide succinyltransferase)